MVFIAPALPLPPVLSRSRATQEFEERREDYVEAGGSGIATTGSSTTKTSSSSSSSQSFTEPHSTKQREDAVGWGLETDAETLVATQLAPRLADESGVKELLSRIDCPVLVIHGRDDAIRPWESGARLAELANGALTVLDGSGHLPHARDPVKVNLLLREFVKPAPRRDAGSAPSPDADERCTSHRRSGWGTPSVTLRSPTNCAGSVPTWTSTGWPSTR